jgi:uncharacterized membrane protein YuzA (DUF378 family)
VSAALGASPVLPTAVSRIKYTLVQLRVLPNTQYFGGDCTVCRHKHLITAVLLVSGDLNWGLVGFSNLNLISALFGGASAFSNTICPCGLSALYDIFSFVLVGLDCLELHKFNPSVVGSSVRSFVVIHWVYRRQSR